MPSFGMRERLGFLLQLVGFVLMPIAVWQGANDAWSFSTELLVAGFGFLLIFVGRGLRVGTTKK
jgi:hypothetical protein